MYTSGKLHKAIEGIVSRAPATVLCDVTTEDIGPFVAIKITDRVNPRGDRYYRAEEIVERSGEGFCREGKSYQHLYFCDETVPAEVVAALAA